MCSPRARAIECYRYALNEFRDIGDRFHQAVVLDHIGDAHDAAGDRRAAEGAWRDALTALGDIDDGVTQRIRLKLGTPARGRHF